LRVARHEAPVHDGQLDPGNEHDAGSGLPQPLRPPGAVGEQHEELIGGQLERAGREPHLQPQLGGAAGGEFQPLRITAGDLDRVAVQVITDNGQLPPDHLAVETLAGNRTLVEESGVVPDALGSHMPTLIPEYAYTQVCAYAHFGEMLA
jgi:hypothetical protein